MIESTEKCLLQVYKLGETFCLMSDGDFTEDDIVIDETDKSD